jgi:hypothetical protein
MTPGGALGQELPWPAKGQVRLDFAPTFWTWDARYGLTADGTKEVEPLGTDLTANPLGSEILPVLADLEARLGQALEDPSYRVSLGLSQAAIDQSRLVFPFRLDIGITDWLSVGGMVPIVRPRTELIFTLDADSMTANEGISPFVTNPTEVVNFVDAFGAVLAEAQAAFPGEPVVAEAQAYLEALNGAYSQGTFFPVDGSGTGGRLQSRFDELKADLAALGFSGLPDGPPLAQEYLTEEAFQGFLGGRIMRAFPLEDWTTLWSLGDVEIHANARLLRRGFQPDSTGVLPTLRYQLGGGILVRLGTGDQKDPLRFFDQDIGDGQMDLEASAFGLLELGERLGGWGRVRYGVQTEGEVFRRIASPSQTLPEYSRLAPLKWTPGDYLEVDLNPRIFLSRGMSFGARYRFWRKGEDSYDLGDVDPEVQDPSLLPPADLLNLETEQTLQEFGFSATFSTVEAHAEGEASLPVYIRATYFHPLAGGGGQTPKGGRFEAGLTIFRTFWGRGQDPDQNPAEPGGRPEPGT